jgi:hypothetical protein
MAIEEMKELEPILHYKMNDLESKAYKIAIIWQDECEKELPKEKYPKLNRNKDPRKTTLFKYCYKLARETKGILEDREIPFYVRAQLQILKSIREGSVHALIEPHCLVGENAWKRWKVWKRKHLKGISRVVASEEVGISAKSSKVINEIRSSAKLLEEKGCFSWQLYQSKKEDLKGWIKNGEISRYYFVLSPWARSLFSELNFDFDNTYYRSSITPKIEEEFRNIFKHEWNDGKVN